MNPNDVTHIKNGAVVFQETEEPTFLPSPSVVSDLAWVSEKEAEEWYERRHGVLNGEGDEFDIDDSEESEDECDSQD